MRITQESLHEESSRMTYWSRIHFESDDGLCRSTVLFCSSHEYLWDLFRAHDKNEVKFDEWQKAVVQKWKNLGEAIFAAPVHYDVYVNSDDGKVNGLKFLKEEVVP